MKILLLFVIVAFMQTTTAETMMITQRNLITASDPTPDHTGVGLTCKTEIQSAAIDGVQYVAIMQTMEIAYDVALYVPKPKIPLVERAHWDMISKYSDDYGYIFLSEYVFSKNILTRVRYVLSPGKKRKISEEKIHTNNNLTEFTKFEVYSEHKDEIYPSTNHTDMAICEKTNPAPKQ